MKMKQTDFLELKQALTEKINLYPDFEKMEYLKNNPEHSQERYRWNLFHSVNTRENNFSYSRKLSEYLTDDNIDTALRKITDTK